MGRIRRCIVKIRQEYRVNSEFVPKNINLVVETPEIFTIWVNGQKIDKYDKGYFIDKTFRKIPIEKYFKCGENIIIFECDFKQSATVYENIKKGKIFESEKNKLTYDMEIEPVYLIGDFSVGICGNIENLDKNAIRANGFKIYPPKESITLSNIEQQGYAFFAGQIRVEKKFDIADTNKKISFNKKGINIVKVSVNGENTGTVAWNPTELDLSEILKVGENTISLTIINNLRNMMGPHHRTEGECYLVTPESFFQENCIWKNDDKDTFTRDYCFTEVGLV